MQYRPLGKSGINVSVLTLGTWQFGDTTATYTKQPEEVEDAIVKTAIDAGINTFDTAEAYANGVAEQALGRALARSGRPRSEYVILSKVNPENIASAQLLEEACNRSLKNLNTPYIDLYQMHWPNHSVDLKPVFETFDKLKKEGKVKAIGVSNFGPLDTADALATNVRIESNQLPYNLVTRAIEYGIQKMCVEHDISILAYSPLAQGLLTGRYKKPEDCHEGLSRSRHFHHTRSARCRHKENGCEKELFEALSQIEGVSKELGHSMSAVSLAWVLKQPGVTSSVVGASKPEQLDQNLSALHVYLSPEALKKLADATEPVKKALGTNPDMWALDTRYR